MKADGNDPQIDNVPDEYEEEVNQRRDYPLDEGELQPPEALMSSADKVIQLNPEYDALLKKMMIQKKMKERLS